MLRNEIRPRTDYGEDFAEAKSYFDLIETALYCTTCNASLKLNGEENLPKGDCPHLVNLWVVA